MPAGKTKILHKRKGWKMILVAISMVGVLPKGDLYFFPPGEEVLKNHKWLKFTIIKPLSEVTPNTHQKHTRHQIPDTDRNEEQSEVPIRMQNKSNGQ